MTVQTLITQHSYVPGSAEAPEALTGIKFHSASDLVVYREPADGGAALTLRLDDHYSIGGNGANAQGTITAIGDYGADTLRVVRNMPLLQPLPLGNFEDLPMDGMEQQLDQQTLTLQDMNRELQRTLRAPLGEAGPGFPAVLDRAGKLMMFDSLGNIDPVTLGYLLDLIGLAEAEGGLIGVSDPLPGQVPRSVEDKLSDFINVRDFGAVGEDWDADWTGFMAALNSGCRNVVVPDGIDWYLSDGLVIPQGVGLVGTSFLPSNPPQGTRLVFHETVDDMIVCGGPTADNQACELRRLILRRESGVVGPANTTGLTIENLYGSIIEDVKVQQNAINYRFKTDGGTKGILAMLTRVFSGGATDVHMEIDGWPELRGELVRFGTNGVLDENCNAYMRIKGGSSTNPASGPNTVVFTNSHFNQGNSAKATRWLEFVDFTPGSIADVGVFKFASCHVESILGGIRTDNTVAVLKRLSLTDVHFNSIVEFWDLDPDTKLQTFTSNGCHYAGSFTLDQNPSLAAIHLSDNRFSGEFDLTSGHPDSNLTATGNTYVGDVTLAGAWQSLEVKGILGGGAVLTNNATGAWDVHFSGRMQVDFTPTLTFDGGNTGIAYSKQAGRCEVRGNEVIAQFEIILSNKGSSTGNARIGGLPFTVQDDANAASSNGSGGIVTYNTNMASLSGPVQLRTPASANQIDLFQNGATGMVRVTNNNFTNTTTIAGTVRYFR